MYVSEQTYIRWDDGGKKGKLMLYETFNCFPNYSTDTLPESIVSLRYETERYLRVDLCFAFKLIQYLSAVFSF